MLTNSFNKCKNSSISMKLPSHLLIIHVMLCAMLRTSWAPESNKGPREVWDTKRCIFSFTYFFSFTYLIIYLLVNTLKKGEGWSWCWHNCPWDPTLLFETPVKCSIIFLLPFFKIIFPILFWRYACGTGNGQTVAWDGDQPLHTDNNKTEKICAKEMNTFRATKGKFPEKYADVSCYPSIFCCMFINWNQKYIFACLRYSELKI